MSLGSSRLPARFIGDVCHEIGQYLHVHGLCSSAFDLSAVGIQERALIEQMDKSARAIEHLVALLHELTTLLSSRHPPDLHPVEVGALLRQLSAHRSWASGDVRLHFPPDPARVSTCPPLLYRLLRYLIDYALFCSEACDVHCRVVRQRTTICLRTGRISRHASSTLDGLTRKTCRALARSIGASLVYRRQGQDGFTMSLALPSLIRDDAALLLRCLRLQS